MKILVLTLVNNEKVQINFDHIEAYGTITENTYQCKRQHLGKTYVLPTNCDNATEAYVVQESPETINDMLMFASYLPVMTAEKMIETKRKMQFAESLDCEAKEVCGA